MNNLGNVKFDNKIMIMIAVLVLSTTIFLMTKKNKKNINENNNKQINNNTNNNTNINNNANNNTNNNINNNTNNELNNNSLINKKNIKIIGEEDNYEFRTSFTKMITYMKYYDIKEEADHLINKAISYGIWDNYYHRPSQQYFKGVLT